MSQEKDIGMDVHQATISVAVIDASGKLIMECLLETKTATIRTELGVGRVFYDRWFEPELAAPNLDTRLQSVYHDESDLVVAWLTSDYNSQRVVRPGVARHTRLIEDRESKGHHVLEGRQGYFACGNVLYRRIY